MQDQLTLGFESEAEEAAKKALEIQNGLAHFSGSEEYHRLTNRHVLTDGAKYLAEKAGALWLMDAIASYHLKAMRDQRTADFQVWILNTVVDRNSGSKRAILVGKADTNEDPFARQNIEYTDFPLDSIKLYVCRADRDTWMIMLPGEY